MIDKRWKVKVNRAAKQKGIFMFEKKSSSKARGIFPMLFRISNGSTVMLDKLSNNKEMLKLTILFWTKFFPFMTFVGEYANEDSLLCS